MSTDTQTSVRISRVINADPDTLFRAWTEPDQLKRWSCPEGSTLADVEMDLTVGGRYRLKMESPDGTVHTAVGVYRAVEAPHRLVYTWRWEEEAYDVGETLVTVEFQDRGGASEVVLTHELFPNAEATGQHSDGWTSCFTKLEQIFA
jgi:uncharacterized protein YndB with AHSA1/START domain